MRVLQVAEIPEEHFQRVYQDNEQLVNASFETQTKVLIQLGFGEEYLFVPFLDPARHESFVSFCNCEHTQIQWAIEQNRTPYWNVLLSILCDQIELIRPDVLVLPLPIGFRTDLALGESKWRPRILVGLLSAPPVTPIPREFDLVLCRDEAVAKQAAQSEARRVELLPPAVNPLMQDTTDGVERIIDVAFLADRAESQDIDALTRVSRLAADGKLTLAAHVDDKVESLSDEIRKTSRPPVQMLDEARLFRSSRFTLYFPDRAGVAGDVRWRKAALMGSVILAPVDSGLEAWLKADKECVLFDGVDDLERRLLELHADSDSRQTISAAAQTAVSSRHTLIQRAATFSKLLEDYAPELKEAASQPKESPTVVHASAPSVVTVEQQTATRNTRPLELAVFALTPASMIRVDRRILNQCRMFTSRGWCVTLVLPGEAAESDVELWPGCQVKTFPDEQCREIGYLYDLLKTPSPATPGLGEMPRLRSLIDELPAPRTPDLFGIRERAKLSESFASDDNIFGPYRITHGCLSVARELRPDAVLAADYQGVVAAWMLRNELGIPYMFDSHEFAMGQWKKSLTCMKLIKHVEELCIRQAFCFYTISDFFGDLFRYEHGLASRPHSIVNAPDFSQCGQLDKQAIPRAFGLPDSARTLLFHGGLQKETRNIERLLRIAPRLQEHDIHLVFLGFGPMYDDIVKAGDNVHFHTAIDQCAMASWVHSATACIVPYIGVGINHRFCTPNRFFDGMEVGTPVIVNESHEYTSGIIREYGVGFSGPMETDEDMLATIQSALRQFRSEPASAENWQAVRERFSFQTQRERLERIIERLELYIGLSDTDEMSRLEQYARLTRGEAVSPPDSLLAENLMRFAASEFEANDSASGIRALQQASEVQSDYPGLDQARNAVLSSESASENAERIRALMEADCVRVEEAQLKPLPDGSNSFAAGGAAVVADTDASSVNVAALHEEGVRLLAAEQFAAAAEVFEKLIAVDSRNATAIYQLGLCRAGQGRTDEAVDCLERTLQLVPGDSGVFFNLIAQCLRRGGAEDARAAFQRFEGSIADGPDKQKCQAALFGAQQ